MSSLEKLARTIVKPSIGLSLVAIILAYYWDWPGIHHPKLPPGPRSRPIFGNILDLKPKHFFEQLRQLHLRYGPIISLKIGRNTLISIGGDGALAHELFNKRGSIYSSRPHQAATEIASKGNHLLFQQKTDKWRAARKPIVQHFVPNMMKTEHFYLQEAESVQRLHEFLHQPGSFMHHPMRFATSVLTCLVYGVRCERYQDPAVYQIEDIMRSSTDLNVPGAKPPLEVFPWLEHLPGALLPWRKRCEEFGNKMEKLYMGLIEAGWQRGVEGFNPDNLAYKMRLDEVRSGLTRHEQGFACGLVLEGGSDVVAGVILTYLLALVHDPESQRRIRAEIDRLYDEDNLPKWQDERSLPYVRALVKEVFRWRPLVPIGVPHKLEKDDYYEGYFLPRGSTVIHCTWAMHSCSERFEEPEKFKPERYLNHDLSMAESTAQGDPFKRDHFGFGAGRRICPGIQTAEQDVFIALSRLVWAFEFTLPIGIETVDVDFCGDTFAGEGVKTPDKFPLVITHRSERRTLTIEREMVIAQQTFAQYGTYK